MCLSGKRPLAETLDQGLTRPGRIGVHDIFLGRWLPRRAGLRFSWQGALQQISRSPCNHWTSERCLENPPRLRDISPNSAMNPFSSIYDRLEAYPTGSNGVRTELRLRATIERLQGIDTPNLVPLDDRGAP